jgi:hypothetical protein
VTRDVIWGFDIIHKGRNRSRGGINSCQRCCRGAIDKIDAY